MMKPKMPAVLLAGLILLSLAGCGADKTTPDSASGTGSRITETITETIPETDTESDLPTAETTAEKEKAESPAPAESGTAAEAAKPAETAKKAEPAPPTQAPKQTEAPKAPEPQPTAPPESRPAETTTPEKPTTPPTEPPKESEQPKGFTEADHNRIVSEVKAYAESYKAKGFTFEWTDELEFGWDVGWMGTPRISRDGVDGTIRTLKYHVDLIYSSGTDPANGVTADSVRYRVVQIEIDGGIAYAVIYG